MNEYGTNAGFLAYHIARGRLGVVGDLDDDDITSARLIGSEFIDGRYVASFPGLKVGMRAQVREWPRQGGSDRYGYAIDSVDVPVEVVNATYEAALRHVQQPGSLFKDWTPGKYKRVSIDGAVSAEYVTYGSAHEIQSQYLIIDQILQPILTGVGSVSPYSGGLVRA